MESIQTSAYSNPPKNSESQDANDTYSPPLSNTSHNAVVGMDPAHKYSKQANVAESLGPRVKRAAKENPNKRKSCSLYIQTDPLFWRHIREQVSRHTKYFWLENAKKLCQEIYRESNPKIDI